MQNPKFSICKGLFFGCGPPTPHGSPPFPPPPLLSSTTNVKGTVTSTAYCKKHGKYVLKQKGAVLRKCTFGMVLLLLLMLVVQLKLENQRSRSTRGGVFDSRPWSIDFFWKSSVSVSEIDHFCRFWRLW